ncbi:MAG: nucleoside triphosphate pyrophosphohydrolase [Ferrimicrobium sp.]|jgi:predicted house-cleaning noncanonical NTP pyrophosphatase (MazG superfamily)|nr:nucleoside triphosphate pyrophosphohydrolase [Ferrimicrobium sp.]
MSESSKSELPKLVRDLIPEMIRASGRDPRTRTLSAHELVMALRVKLQEEVAEYLAEPSLEELADVTEVIKALVATHDAQWEDLEAVRVDKRQRCGGFDRGVWLVGLEG